MVSIFLTYTDRLNDPVFEPDITRKFGGRGERILRPVSAEARRERLGEELLLKKILPRYDKSPDEIDYTETGKPVLSGLYLSVSHGGGAVLLAVSDCPVGCDVERVRKYPVRVAERKFTQTELQTLYSCPPEERDGVFFRFWTAKESYLKMTGEGLKSLCGIQADIVNGEIIRENAVQSCRFKQFLRDGFVISVCSEDRDFMPLQRVEA